MGGLFKTPDPVVPPAVKPVSPPPEVVSEEIKAEQAGKGRRRRGREETIITGELEPATTKKTLLG